MQAMFCVRWNFLKRWKKKTLTCSVSFKPERTLLQDLILKLFLSGMKSGIRQLLILFRSSLAVSKDLKIWKPIYLMLSEKALQSVKLCGVMMKGVLLFGTLKPVTRNVSFGIVWMILLRFVQRSPRRVCCFPGTNLLFISIKPAAVMPPGPVFFGS